MMSVRSVKGFPLKVVRPFSSNYSSEAVIRPYEDIPTPPGGWVPFFGHAHLMIKKPHGLERAWKNVAELKTKFVPPGVELLRLNLPVLNPDGDGRVLQIFDPKDIQEVYRHEGKYPNRGSLFSGFELLRSRRPDVFGETSGVLVENGERWQQLRSKVQQDMMRPKSATFYLNKLDNIANEFIDKIRKLRVERDQSIQDFLPLAHRFSLESITVIALDTHLGCFEENPSKELLQYIAAVDVIVQKFPDLLMSFPTWKYVPPRWSPIFRSVEDNFNIVVDFVKKNIDAVYKKLEEKDQSISNDGEISILEKLIIKNGPKSAITYVMAFDMVIAGIDTTGNTLAFLLYNLATNPDKQKKLREEIKSFGRETLTGQDYGQMKYYRACMQESFRITPTAANMVRVLPQDTVIRGYNVPAGTMATWFTKIIGRNPDIFPNPDEFIPERWIDNKNDINPFAVRNFSHGPRMCIGKRFAELEIQIAICKLVQRFQVDWVPDYKIDPVTTLLNVPDHPLVFKFNEVS